MIRPLPEHLHELAETIAEYARREELDFYPTVFEVLNSEQISQIAAYGGFPQRYPHWRFGMEYERLPQATQVRAGQDLRDGDQQQPVLRLPAQRQTCWWITRR